MEGGFGGGPTKYHRLAFWYKAQTAPPIYREGMYPSLLQPHRLHLAR